MNSKLRRAVRARGHFPNDEAALKLLFLVLNRAEVGSRQYRAVEDQLIPRPLFTAMQAAGPLPVAVPTDAMRYLQDRKEMLEARLREVCDKAAQDQLVDVRLSGDTLKISPLQATTPEDAERLADRVYALLPQVRMTDLLDEVAEWTGAAECFTHLRTGLSAEDRRVILTAVLADATNLGLTRMAEVCSVASYKRLACSTMARTSGSPSTMSMEAAFRTMSSRCAISLASALRRAFPTCTISAFTPSGRRQPGRPWSRSSPGGSTKR